MSRSLSACFSVLAVALSLVSVGCGDGASPGTDAHVDTGKTPSPDGSSDTGIPVPLDAGTHQPDVTPLDSARGDASPTPDAFGASDVVATDTAVDGSSADGVTSTLDAGSSIRLDGAVSAADADETTAPIDTGTDLASADAGGADAVAPSDAATSPDAGRADDGPAVQKFGNVILSESSASMSVAGMSMTVVSAAAVAAFHIDHGNNCVPSVTLGGCEYFDCSASQSSVTRDYLFAGTVTIDGLDTAMPLSFNSDTKLYMSSAYTSFLWNSSRPVTLTVTGSSDIPAFTLSTTAPNPIVVTSPLPDGSAGTLVAYSVSRASDLVVTWSGGVDGEVMVTMGGGSEAEASKQIVCTVGATKGTLSVPASLLRKLGGTPNFGVTVRSLVWKTVGDWVMGFEAYAQRDPGTITFTD